MLRTDRCGVTAIAMQERFDVGALVVLCHGGSRESALLLQRGAVVGRFHYRIREEQARAAVAAAVALQQRGPSGPKNESIHAGLGRPFLDPDGNSHPTSRRLTAASMNRRPSRARLLTAAKDV
jgi:hypothetical protein